MTHENHKDFKFISNKVNDHENGKLSRVDLIYELVKYTEQLRNSGVVGQSKQLICEHNIDKVINKNEEGAECRCGYKVAYF